MERKSKYLVARHSLSKIFSPFGMIYNTLTTSCQIHTKMAITKQENQNQVGQPHSRLIRLIAIALLALIFLTIFIFILIKNLNFTLDLRLSKMFFVKTNSVVRGLDHFHNHNKMISPSSSSLPLEYQNVTVVNNIHGSEAADTLKVIASVIGVIGTVVALFTAYHCTCACYRRHKKRETEVEPEMGGSP